MRRNKKEKKLTQNAPVPLSLSLSLHVGKPASDSAGRRAEAGPAVLRRVRVEHALPDFLAADVQASEPPAAVSGRHPDVPARVRHAAGRQALRVSLLQVRDVRFSTLSGPTTSSCSLSLSIGDQEECERRVQMMEKEAIQ